MMVRKELRDETTAIDSWGRYVGRVCGKHTRGSTCPAGPSDQRQTGEGQPGADCCVGQLWAGRRGAETTGVCPCVGAGWFADIQHRQHNIRNHFPSGTDTDAR
ncbi:MAG: hypothetical protein ACRDC6_10790 [Shewanella sp.]